MYQVNVTDFIKKLKEVEKKPTLYKLGTFLNKKENGYLLCDCSGLIKGVLWGFPSNGQYQYKGVPDVNADTMITKCRNVSTDFNDIPVGSLVWLPGHVGIYVGSKQVIESSPKWENGVQFTHLNSRKWKKHGLMPWVDYSKKSTNTINYDLEQAVKIIAKYVKQGYFGNGHDNRKDKIYKLIKEEVNK